MLGCMLPRRRFLLSSLALAAFESLPAKLLRAAAPVFKALPAWKPGVLEIHQIATIAGNSTLLILPDGTTMMVDAGAIYGTTPYLRRSASFRSASSRRVDRPLCEAAVRCQWTYKHRHFLLTHLHGDHAAISRRTVRSHRDGSYRLTGVADVAAIVPIQRFVDRAWPDYTYPVPATLDFQKNYRAFLEVQAKGEEESSVFAPAPKTNLPCSTTRPSTPASRYANLIAKRRSLGPARASRRESFFPELSTLKPADYPAEKSVLLRGASPLWESSATTPAAI